MRYVIIRDDDTNALTPPEYLERLYRPLLERGLPINLATVPEVTTEARMANGQPEGFLLPGDGEHALGSARCADRMALQAVPTSLHGKTIPLPTNEALVNYLHENPGYHIVQH